MKRILKSLRILEINLFSKHDENFLPAIFLFISFYNFIFILISYQWKGEVIPINLALITLPALFSIFLWTKGKAYLEQCFLGKSYLSKEFLLLLHKIAILILLVFDYYLVGKIGEGLPILKLYDPFFLSVEKSMIGDLSAQLIYYRLNSLLGSSSFYVYNIFVYAYFLYYPLVFLGFIHLFQRENIKWSKRIKLLNHYTLSITFLLCFSFLLYLLIPVTGPQYFLIQAFSFSPLPISGLAYSIYLWIERIHPNKIDCFPSVHTGLTLLITIWAFKIGSYFRYYCLILLILIVCATLALRYHYLLDILVAPMLVYLSLKLSRKVLRFRSR